MRFLLRHWRALAVIVAVIVPGVLLVLLSLFDARDMLTDGGIEGPYAVGPGGTLGAPMRSVAAGGLFGWRSTLCLKPGIAMLARTELVRVGSGRVYEARTRRWLPGERACGPLAGMMRVSPDAPPDRYRLCRVGVLRPDGWLPLVVRLGCIEVEVLEPARRDETPLP